MSKFRAKLSLLNCILGVAGSIFLLLTPHLFPAFRHTVPLWFAIALLSRKSAVKLRRSGRRYKACLAL